MVWLIWKPARTGPGSGKKGIETDCETTVPEASVTVTLRLKKPVVGALAGGVISTVRPEGSAVATTTGALVPSELLHDGVTPTGMGIGTPVESIGVATNCESTLGTTPVIMVRCAPSICKISKLEKCGCS